jgi:hypothetical protein
MKISKYDIDIKILHCFVLSFCLRSYSASYQCNCLVGAHIHRVRGVSAPLHYKFQRVNGIALVRTKMNVQQRKWSDTFCCWRFEPIGRECSFTLADMGACAYRPVTADAVKKMHTAIESCRGRLSTAELASCLADLKMLANQVIKPFAWENGGTFVAETKLDDRPREVDVIGDGVLHTISLSHLREHPRIWSSSARLAKEREDAKRTTVPLSVGDFVAVSMDYGQENHTIPEEQQHPFWVGKCIGIYKSTDRIMVHWYHSAARQRWLNGKFKVWNIGKKTELVPVASIWAVWTKMNESRIPTE